MQAVGTAAAPFLAVDPRDHRVGLRRIEFVGRHQIRTQYVAAVEVLTLGRAEERPHFGQLKITAGYVVEDRVARYQLIRLLNGEVATGLGDDDRELQLVVHPAFTDWPSHRSLSTHDG